MKLVDDITLDLRRQGWSFQENVIPRHDLVSLQSTFDLDFVPAKVGKGQNHQRVESIRGDWTYWVDPLSPLPEFKGIIHLLDQLVSGLNQHLFLGIKQYETHLAKYPTGTFYQKHSDRHSNESARVVSFIFYLHEFWGEEDGGELVLYDKSDNILKSIVPVPGSMICFMSDEFPHEVKPSRRERRSLTGWMHNKIIY